MWEKLWKLCSSYFWKRRLKPDMRMSRLALRVRKWLKVLWSILCTRVGSRLFGSMFCGRIDKTPFATGMFTFAVCSVTLGKIIWSFWFAILERSCQTYPDVTIGLPLTENTGSPARAWRNIENGYSGFPFGVIVYMRSTLIAFCRVKVLIGVRYFDLEAWWAGWWRGVRPLVLIARGPGVVVDGKLLTDLLRRRLWIFFMDPTIETFCWWYDLFRTDSDPDVIRASVR